MTRFTNCRFFTAEKLEVGEKAQIPEDRYFTMLTVVEGSGTIDGENVRPGMSALVTSGDKDIILTGPMTVMIGTPGKGKF